jgi:hypothetical protein
MPGLLQPQRGLPGDAVDCGTSLHQQLPYHGRQGRGRSDHGRPLIPAGWLAVCEVRTIFHAEEGNSRAIGGGYQVWDARRGQLQRAARGRAANAVQAAGAPHSELQGRLLQGAPSPCPCLTLTYAWAAKAGDSAGRWAPDLARRARKERERARRARRARAPGGPDPRLPPPVRAPSALGFGPLQNPHGGLHFVRGGGAAEGSP